MDDLLNKYIVEDEGIVDVLGVSRYDALWNNVMDFMEYDYSEGGDVGGETEESTPQTSYKW